MSTGYADQFQDIIDSYYNGQFEQMLRLIKEYGTFDFVESLQTWVEDGAEQQVQVKILTHIIKYSY
jgi:hypothetical protein